MLLTVTNIIATNTSLELDRASQCLLRIRSEPSSSWYNYRKPHRTTPMLFRELISLSKLARAAKVFSAVDGR